MLFDQFLVIDYGTRYIKGLLFKNILGTISVIRCETLKIVHLEDEEMDEYEYNVVRFIQSFFPEEFKFVTNVNLDRLYIRDLTIPLTNPKAVREIIPFEVENQLPFPSESMEVAGILSKIDSENSYVVTFNIEKNELERVINPYTKGEASLACLSVDSYCLSAMLFQEIELKKKSQQAIPTYIGQLDIGYENSFFNACQSGTLYHTRSFQTGAGDLVRFIQEELNLTEDSAEECMIYLSPYLLTISEALSENLELIWKKYKISTQNWKNISSFANDYAEKIVRETEKSIYSLIETEKPQELYLSGGGSKLVGLDNYIMRRLEIPVLRYSLPESIQEDVSFIQAYSTGLHYLGKVPQKIDYLKSDFARKIQKNVFRLGKFVPHLVLTGVALFILLFVFVFGIVIDRKKISQNRNILVEKYRNGFGEEPPDSQNIMPSAINKLKQEQKKTEIFRLFLNKMSVLDAIAEATEHFPDKETFQFQLTKIIFQDDELQIYGKVNEYAEIGTIEQALAKSTRFRDIKVLDKRMSPGINKFKVSFKIRMLINKPESD